MPDKRQTAHDRNVAQLRRQVAKLEREVAEQNRTIEMLRERERLYRNAVAAANAVAYQVDFVTGSYWYMNHGIEQLTGYEVEEATPQLWPKIAVQSVMKGEAAGLSEKEADRRFRAGKLSVWNAEYQCRRKDGQLCWLSDVSIPVLDEQGNVCGSVGILQECTQRKMFETEVNGKLEKETNERQRTQLILQSIAEAATYDGGAGFFPLFVRHLATTLGVRYAFVCEPIDFPVTRARTIAGWLEDHVETDFEYDVISTPCEETLRGKVTFYPRNLQELFPHDKTLVALGAESYCGWPVCNDSDQVVGHLVVMDDRPMEDDFSKMPALRILASRAAAELRRLHAEKRVRQQQEELAHGARLNMMGEIATGLAHELNQPLAAIATLARAGQHALDKEASPVRTQVPPLLEKVIQQANRAGEIIRHLRSLVRKSPAHRSSIDVNALTSEVIELMASDGRWGQMSLETDLDSSLPPAFADRVQIQQVVINLLQNALDAMQELPPEERVLRITTSVTTDKAVEITVSDTGQGLSPEEADQIFDAFYTAKDEGLGMGLAISRSIVQEHGGRIWATPNALRGTTFHFTISTEGPQSSDQRT